MPDEADTPSSETTSAPVGTMPSVHGAEAKAASAVDFATLIGRLKTTPRTGWVRRGVPRYESVADHSWRVAALTFLLLGPRRRGRGHDQATNDADRGAASSKDDPDSDLDVSRCLQMAIIHDLAECLVGDIAPGDHVSADEKRRRESDAMALLATSLGRATNPDAESHLLDLFHEYERRETMEAKCVKDLDLLDMILQADEYERTFGMDLGEFFSSTPPSRFQTPWIRAIARDVHNRRSIQKDSSTTSADDKVRSSAWEQSPSDEAFIEEHSKASMQDRSDIAQVVRALRGWESRSTWAR